MRTHGPYLDIGDHDATVCQPYLPNLRCTRIDDEDDNGNAVVRQPHHAHVQARHWRSA
jgi:hypothetical protein